VLTLVEKVTLALPLATPSTSPHSAATLELKRVDAAAIVDAPDDVTDDFFDNFEASTNEVELHDVLDNKMPFFVHNLPDAENALDDLPTHGDVFHPSSTAGSVDNLPVGGDVCHPLSVAGSSNTAMCDDAAFCPVSATGHGDAAMSGNPFCPLSGVGGGAIPAPTPTHLFYEETVRIRGGGPSASDKEEDDEDDEVPVTGFSHFAPIGVEDLVDTDDEENVSGHGGEELNDVGEEHNPEVINVDVEEEDNMEDDNPTDRMNDFTSGVAALDPYKAFSRALWTHSVSMALGIHSLRTQEEHLTQTFFHESFSLHLSMAFRKLPF